METKRICPSCQKALPPDVPMGLCPECLIKSGFATGTDPAAGAEAAGTRFVPPSVAEIARLFPQFEILEFIGKGGMGAVYKARQPALDRFVALKILNPTTAGDPGFAERFNREARALARLNHPNIVAVHDFGKVGQASSLSPDTSEQTGKMPVSLHYVVMEFVDGANLRDVERAGRLSPEQALSIVPQICEALQFAHNEGIVHRDIKPENLLLDKKGRVKITDFGIAKIVGITGGKVSLTGARDVVGTPHYMAPEQIEKPQTVDHRADIYSLGVVFYEMLTGELPLGRFQPPSSCAGGIQIDVRLDQVVLRALEKEPARRYQHASVLKTEVETISSTAPAAAAVPGGPIMPPLRGSAAASAGWTQHLKRGAWAGFAVFLLITLSATVITNLLPESYKSTSRILVSRAAPSIAILQQPLSSDSITTEVTVIQSYAVLEKVIARLKLDERWGRRYGAQGKLKMIETFNLLHNRMEVRPSGTGGGISIHVFSELPNEAAEIANAIAEGCAEYHAEQLRALRKARKDPAQNASDLPSESQLLRIIILEQATPPLHARPNRPLNIALGVIAGVALGVIAGVLRFLVSVTKARRQAAGIPTGSLKGSQSELSEADRKNPRKRSGPNWFSVLLWLLTISVAVVGILLLIWSATRSNRKPIRVIPGQMIISVGAAGNRAILEGNAYANARFSVFVGGPTNALTWTFSEPTLFTAALENGPRGLNCQVTTASGQAVFNTNDAAQFGNVKIGEGKLEFRSDRPPANQSDGTCSVTLGWWTPKSGASIPIGAVLTAARSDSSADTATSGVSFGPVIETVVETSNWQRGYDLDAGRMMEAGSQRQHSGADLVAAQTTTGTESLYFIGTRAEHFPDGEARWNMAAWIVATNLALIPEQIDAFTNADGFSHTAALMPKDSSQPETYLFRTLQGGMGVLQITGFTDKPRGVKIRYKLVQNGEAVAEATERPSPITPTDLQLRIARANDMRQVLLAALEYADANKREWPASLSDLGQSDGKSFIENISASLEYHRPKHIIAPTNGVIDAYANPVLFEKKAVSADGEWVGFADGHLVFVKDAAKLRELRLSARDAGRSNQQHARPQIPELEFRLVAREHDTSTSADVLADPNDRTGQTKLRVLKEILLDSSSVASASAETDSHQSESKTISIRLKEDAARKFGDITANNIGRQLAIVWRGRVLSAPIIRTPITGPAVSVTGNLSEAESLVLLELLNYKPGSPPAPQK